MTEDARALLAHFREYTGEWFCRPQLRLVLGLEPSGFGEPVVGNCLREISHHDVVIQEDVAWCYFRKPRGHEHARAAIEVVSFGPGTPAEVTETIGGAERWSRENVYRLP